MKNTLHVNNRYCGFSSLHLAENSETPDVTMTVRDELNDEAFPLDFEKILPLLSIYKLFKNPLGFAGKYNFKAAKQAFFLWLLKDDCCRYKYLAGFQVSFSSGSTGPINFFQNLAAPFFECMHAASGFDQFYWAVPSKQSICIIVIFMN